VRVARIITRLNVGGPSIQAIALSERLSDRGVETLLVHGSLGADEGDMRYLLSDRRVDVRRVAALRRQVAPIHDVAAVAALYRLLRCFHPDVVHTHMAKAGAVGRLAALAYNRTAARGRRARIVHTYHGHVLDGYFGGLATRFFTGAERQLARVCDAIVAISPEIRNELVHEHHIGTIDRYRVIPLGFDLRAFAAIDDAGRAAARRALGVPMDGEVVTTVGRLTAIKQHRVFFDVARAIADRRPRSIFLVAGDGELRSDLEDRVRELRLADRVRFLGWRRDLTTIYGATDVFLLTSRNEGTPVALIEALASGVTGVSTDVGGVRDVITGPEVGALAPVAAVAALSDRVCALLDDPVRRRTMGEAGRTLVLQRYGLDRLVDDIDRLYRDLLG
jgi:glycosyltransferase involved in cell wall biosynthesis